VALTKPQRMPKRPSCPSSAKWFRTCHRHGRKSRCFDKVVYNRAGVEKVMAVLHTAGTRFVRCASFLASKQSRRSVEFYYSKLLVCRVRSPPEAAFQRPARGFPQAWKLSPIDEVRRGRKYGVVPPKLAMRCLSPHRQPSWRLDPCVTSKREETGPLGAILSGSPRP